MVLERNHRFLPPQISWIVDFNSVCFILIRGSSVITQIDHRSDHRCLLPPLSPNRRPACVSCPAAAAAACARLYQVAVACARLFPGGGGGLRTTLPRRWRRPPSTSHPRTALPRRRGLHACLPRFVRTVLPRFIHDVHRVLARSHAAGFISDIGELEIDLLTFVDQTLLQKY